MASNYIITDYRIEKSFLPDDVKVGYLSIVALRYKQLGM